MIIIKSRIFTITVSVLVLIDNFVHRLLRELPNRYESILCRSNNYFIYNCSTVGRDILEYAIKLCVFYGCCILFVGWLSACCSWFCCCCCGRSGIWLRRSMARSAALYSIWAFNICDFKRICNANPWGEFTVASDAAAVNATGLYPTAAAADVPFCCCWC